MLTERTDEPQGFYFLVLAMSSEGSPGSQESELPLPSKYHSRQQNLGWFACCAPEPDTPTRVSSQVHKISRPKGGTRTFRTPAPPPFHVGTLLDTHPGQ